MPHSKDSDRELEISFYESGIGETIVITFPDGGLGIIDAHPSQANDRPSITEITRDKKIHFVCLTHPHADHGKDLISLLSTHDSVGEFWHTLTDVQTLIFSAGETPAFRSPFREVVKEFRKGAGNFLVEIYGHVAERDIPDHKLRADLEEKNISGVKVHVLSPTEREQNSFTRAYKHIAEGKRRNTPDPNSLSAVIALEYGGKSVLLGSDALKRNWLPAIEVFERRKLPKASVLKVPHHGAGNALERAKQKKSYLSLCEGEATSVLFAGDSKHPQVDVEMVLKQKTRLACLANGRCKKNARSDANPLGIGIPGAIAVSKAISPCQPKFTVRISDKGNLDVTQGFYCSGCPNN